MLGMWDTLKAYPKLGHIIPCPNGAPWRVEEELG